MKVRRGSINGKKEVNMANLKSKGKDSGRQRSGGKTKYHRKGKECTCDSKRTPATTEARDKALAKRTNAQRDNSDWFSAATLVESAAYRVLEDWNMWNDFARDLTVTGWNLCHMINGPYCDGSGVINFPAFVFSIGWLANPTYTLVKREGWTVTLQWTSTARQLRSGGRDRLMVGYFHAAHPDCPQFLEDTGARREDGKVTLTLPRHDAPEGDVLHVYPFFVRRNGTDFSRSLYFRVADGMDGEV